MDDDTLPERLLGPSQEGSTSAMLVLRMMANWGAPIGDGELLAATGLDSDALKMTLRGLRERGRVVPLGQGADRRWQLKHVLLQGAPR